jgi:RNA polymerase sigma factor (sigma-70 family)
MLQHDDVKLIDAIRRRDESAFVQLVGRYQGPLLRLALVYARSHAVAEEIVQDTWLAVLQGIDRFENRSSFKTWLFRILVNRARTRAEREGRMVPFSADADGVREPWEGSVPEDRFLAADRDLTCKELVELVTDYLEGALPAETERRFEEHLARCPFCQIYLDQMRQTIRAVGHLPDESISREALDTLLAHFRRWR